MKTVPLRNYHKHHIFNKVESCKFNMARIYSNTSRAATAPLYCILVIPFAKFKIAASTNHPTALILDPQDNVDGNDR